MFGSRTEKHYRVGLGYDIHAIGTGETLVLGGMTLPFDINGESMGLIAHSDGDVLTHAIIDAMLGAAALGDIGDHFPDTDPAYKGADSMVLLDHTNKLIRKQGYEIVNIDATIIAERPKLTEHKLGLAKNLATALNIFPDQINIKATTNEKLDATGNMKGIAVHAVCMLVREGDKKGSD